MKKLVILSVILFGVLSLSAQQSVIYVKQGAKGNGSSWTNAFGDLQSALFQVQSGQEIWVAAGTYHPTRDNDRKQVFRIRNDIRLYGGFSGREKRREERDWYANLTILSGEIGAPDHSDNSYTVVYTRNASPKTVVDGFVITGAYSNGTSPLGTIERSGGGWFNDGSTGISSPTIANCLFIDNYARDGAAIYNFAHGGQCEPRIVGCQFISNNAHLEGAAIFNDGRNGKANPLIDNCYFLENSSNYGAAIRNLADGGEALSMVSNSVFEANVSYVREIIYNGAKVSTKSKTTLKDCRFFDNTVSMGSNNNNVSDSPKKQGYRKDGEIKYLRY